MLHHARGTKRGVAAVPVAAAIGIAAAASQGRPPPGGGGGGPPADPAIAFLWGTTLRVMNADGSNATTIYTAPYTLQAGVSGPSWSPDGGSVAFRDHNGSISRIDVRVVGGTPQGINRIELVLDPGVGAHHICPAWSPLGDEIAFAEVNSGTLRIIPATGGAQAVLFVPPPGRAAQAPAWSPDGSRIAFYEYGGGPRSIRVIERASGLVTTVFGPQDMYVYTIDWARTQDAIVFDARLEGDSTHIYGLALTPGATPQLLRAGASPSWSPDDAHLAFVNTSTNRIGRVHLATGSVTTSGKGSYPNWRR